MVWWFRCIPTKSPGTFPYQVSSFGAGTQTDCIVGGTPTPLASGVEFIQIL